MINPKYAQVNCIESDKLDLRQANAIKNLKPDIVVLEYPNSSKTPSLKLNDYSPDKKPKNLIEKRTKGFSEEVIKANPWVRSDIVMWKNLASLWETGHQTMIYAVDGPHELVNEWFEVWKNMYPYTKKQLALVDTDLFKRKIYGK